jgi:zinc transporter, ZIP family
VTPERATPRGRLWVAGLIPLALLAVLIAAIVRTSPGERLRAPGSPPIEDIAVDRTVLKADGIRLDVVNTGPDPVTIAQVSVDDAYWAFTASRGTALGRLGRTTLTIPYPWVEGEAHHVKLHTRSGAVFTHEIAVAVTSPEVSRGQLLTFTLIGLYVGVIPVALGLLWLPLASRLGGTGIDVLLAVTLGLLVFLLVDTVHEGLEGAASIPAAYQGTALFVASAAGAWLALDVIGGWLRRRRARARSAESGGAILALLVAVGIGLHNFGEGLAIGAAFALGQAALGTLLIIGFTLHNTTEGLAIVAPIAKERPSIATLIRLGAIGGLPTIAGAWVGGLVYSPIVGVCCLGLGAGAIAQVVHQIARQMAGPRPIAERFASPAIAFGLLAGFIVMYATGILAA